MTAKFERSEKLFNQGRVHESKRVQEDDDDTDADLEELIERSVRRFIGVSHSAHGNLAQLANSTATKSGNSFGKTEEEERSNQEDEDSDEEFYVHEALLPFRKSKSAHFGFTRTTSSTTESSGKMKDVECETNVRQPQQLDMLYVKRNTTANSGSRNDMPLLCSPMLNSFNTIWPEPDTDYRSRSTNNPTLNLHRGDILAVQVDARKNEGEEYGTESCWSAPMHLLSPSPSNLSSEDIDEEASNQNSELENLREECSENLTRSWSAPPSLFEYEENRYKNNRDDEESFSIRPIKSSQIRRSFSTDFLVEKHSHKRRHHITWSRSCYVLSAADEQEEDEYIARNCAKSESSSTCNHQSDEEKMSMSEDRMSISEEEEEEEDQIETETEENEEADQLDENLEEFSAGRRSQLFIRNRLPQSKSDGHLLANAPSLQKRPRTPWFNESSNNESFPAAFIPHSATYSGRAPNLKMSSGRSFIERLKRRQSQGSKEILRKHSNNKEAKMLDDLVESFDIDYQQSDEEDLNESDRLKGWIPKDRTPESDDVNQNALDGFIFNNAERIMSTTKQTISNNHIEPDEVKWRHNHSDEVKWRHDHSDVEIQNVTPPQFHLFQGEEDSIERPDSLLNHRKISDHGNKTTPDHFETPAEHQANLCDLTTGSNESDEVMAAGRSAYLYYATTTVDDSDIIPMADDDSLLPCSVTEIVQQSRQKVKPALRRRSPPIASEDELTDSEISDLERQLANRQPSLESVNNETREQEDMPSQGCQSPDVQLYYCRQPRYFLSGSSSMPSFTMAYTNSRSIMPVYTVIESDEHSQLEGAADQRLRKSKTQQFDQRNGDIPVEGNLVQNAFLSGSRRRMLPMRPDAVGNQGRLPQKAIVLPIQQQAQRRLPPLPQSPSNSEQSFGYPVMNVKLATNQPNNSYGQQRSLKEQQIVHPLLMEHTNPPPQANLPPKGTIASQLGHTGDYQLSYGIDPSLVRSTTNYGLEDSYYEDGLNGNATHLPQRKAPYNQEDSSGISSLMSSDPYSGPTHRAQFTFVPRHDDEILLEIGDPVRVDREYEDHWCFGSNLRTGYQGIFPVAHLFPVDPIDEITNSVLPTNNKPRNVERDTFYLTLLASIEVAHHKGNDVLVQAINKVCELYQSKEEILVPQTVLMEISFRGIHVIDKMKKDIFRCPAFDYFYSLQNISFCGAHPKQLRYFGFITKHPLLPRFACHVFLSESSTQPIVESIGRAFKRSYNEYMAFIHPTEDIYLE